VRSVRASVGNRRLAVFALYDSVDVSTNAFGDSHTLRQLFAIDAECPHQGAALEEGDIEEVGSASCVACPRHGWTFDLRTGWCDDLYDYGVRAYEVRCLVDRRICVADVPNPQPD